MRRCLTFCFVLAALLLVGMVSLPVSAQMNRVVYLPLVGNVEAVAGKLPIVFVHGWKGMDFSGCTRPDDYPDTYFQSVDEYLQQAGYPVYYARLETSYCYTPPLRANVVPLTTAINQAKTDTQQPKVILIAHSMGGLVSRAYIEGPEYAGDVAALFTFGSPHLGTPIVDLLVFAGDRRPLSVYCLFQPAACEFSVRGMYYFNQQHRQRDGVEYHVIGGNAPFFDRTALGMVTGVLIPGPDDGIVPTGSGTATGLGTMDRWVTDEVHGPGGDGGFGARTYFIRDGGPSTSYTACLKKVLVDQASTTCGAVQAQSTGPHVGAMAEDGGELAQAADPDLAQRIPFAHGRLLAGQTAHRTITLEGGPTLVAAHWQAGDLRMDLRDPRGQHIDPQYAASHPDEVVFKADGTTTVYYLLDARAGTWRLELTGTNVPEEGSAYSTFAAFNSGLALTGAVDRDTYVPGATAILTARLAGSPARARVTATIIRADGVQTTVTLLPHGRDTDQAAYQVPDVLGYFEVRLQAQGVGPNGADFERGATLMFLVERP